MAAPPEQPFLRVEKRPGGYALVVLCREPVNTMNLAFWQQLTATLDELEGDPSVRGAIFCSGLTRDVFTAGNDINELYAPLTSKERYRCASRQYRMNRGSLRWTRHMRVGAVGCRPPGATSADCRQQFKPRPQSHVHQHSPFTDGPGTLPCREFWVVSNRFLARLYTSPLVTVAAIRGAADGRRLPPALWMP